MKLAELKEQFLHDLAEAKSAEAREELRTKYLGRKQGLITNFQKSVDMRAMSVEARKEFGKLFNQLKELAENAFAGKTAGEAAGDIRPEIDLTMPVSAMAPGSLHPVSLVQLELEQLFTDMGFMVDSGYEVETEFNNFDGPNIPKDHPAREAQDTFWLTNGLLLRTHTTANQVRVMRRFGAPLRAIFPGRCFRAENLDASHENTFYQLEGLMIDKNITIANLIAVMKTLLSGVFHKEVTVRLRPGFFPFTEPGFELDIECLICGGSGCPTCKRSGWVELLPCGLIHPNVLKNGQIDPNEYSGFAFGVGLTRLAMMKYGISDIRYLNGGDIRVLSQFPAML